MKNTRLDSHWDWIRAMALIWVGLGLLLLPSHPHAQSLGSIDAIDDTATTPAGAPVADPNIANGTRRSGCEYLQDRHTSTRHSSNEWQHHPTGPKAGFAALMFLSTLSDGVALTRQSTIPCTKPLNHQHTQPPNNDGSGISRSRTNIPNTP